MKVWLLYMGPVDEDSSVVGVYSSFSAAIAAETLEKDMCTEEDGSCYYRFRIVPKDVE
jgi:hypothetical protein